MINIQNLIRDSLKRSWNMFKMLKPWKVMCFTRNCSSLEASNSMGSELTIFLQEGAWEKTHANISSSYEPMIVHESERLEFSFFFSMFFGTSSIMMIMAMNLVALRTWPCAKAYAPECTMSPWVWWVKGSEGCPLADCSTGRLRRFKISHAFENKIAP